VPSILIVDDDPQLLDAVHLALVDEHEVAVALGGAAALAHLRSGARYDLVLCDLHMDGMTGIEVLETLERELPEVAHHFVFMTGGPLTERARQYLAHGQREYLLKPFGLDHLSALVRARSRRNP
jgi:two-component system, NtrC family, sensor kinase